MVGPFDLDEGDWAGRSENILLLHLVACEHPSRGFSSLKALLFSSLKVGGKAGKEVWNWASSVARWYLMSWKEMNSPTESVNRDESQSQSAEWFSSPRRSGKRTHRVESYVMTKN